MKPARALAAVLVAGVTLGAGARTVDEPLETGGSVGPSPMQQIQTIGGGDPRPTGQIGEDRSWRLAFNDEFDAAELDSSVWAPLLLVGGGRLHQRGQPRTAVLRT